MEKLTDEQIIKALEICLDFVSGGESRCIDCPLHDYDVCSSEKLKFALDLINRKDAEIERLNNELVSADEVIGFREAEIERLQEVTTNTVNSSIRFGLDKEQEIRKAKSEAYKEFAERLKAKATSTFYEEHKYVDTEDIDEVLEELIRRWE